MSQTIINNNDSGLTVRTELNAMFTELYGSIIAPIKVPGVGANYAQPIPANTFIQDVSLSAGTGAPLVRVGLNPGGSELMPDTLIGNSTILNVQYYMQAFGNIYFTVSGGTFSFRVDVQYNYY
jgi:hypothetical protein